ncbi:hypothetical protein DFO67_108200 [Modicisalibacter xianhensis]|uniref:Uncharacterized protein n=1 Tax=Modicisalibacter xianhensis TaxID=442341 RepID=A0A4R8G230_9GAMM|nr:hypothetical protein [Halomonas xianhensis]TDX29156.1 hypothetical protein DFO67_108200 [Halomonas xianhensis]
MDTGSVVTYSIDFDTNMLGKSISIDSVMGAKVCGMLFNPVNGRILIVVQKPDEQVPEPLEFVVRGENDNSADILNEVWVGSFFYSMHLVPYHVFKVF